MSAHSQDDEPSRPTAEELAQKYAADPDFISAADAESAEQREYPYLKLFRKALKQYCMRLFWCQVEQSEKHNTVTQLANKFELFRQQIYAAQAGGIDADVFFCVLADKGWNYTDIAPMPSVCERALGAFCLAIQHLQQAPPAKFPKGSIPEQLPHEQLIDGFGFLTISLLITDELFQTPGIQLATLRDHQWEQIIGRILTRLRPIKAFPEVQLQKIDPEYLRQGYLSWAKWIGRVRAAVPRKWAQRAENKVHP